MFLPEFSYYVDFLKIIERKQPLPLSDLYCVGGRFSGKTTNALLFVLLALNIPNVKIGCVFVRASKDSIYDMWSDTTEVADNFDLEYRGAKANWEMRIGSNKIKFIGLNSMTKSTAAKKAGFPRFSNVDYIFVFFEEAYEFKKSDMQAIKEAIRHIGQKTPSYLYIHCCNPWALTNWFIEYCNSQARFNENVLKTTGSQISFVEKADNETGIVKKSLFHYTNWRVAKEVLSPTQIDNVRQYWTTDRNRARVADYGMPGYEFGAIYVHELHKIAEPMYYSGAQYVMGGMDYGWSMNDNRGITACYFITGTTEFAIDIHGEYTHDNSKRPITQNELAFQVVRFYEEQMTELMNQTGNGVPLQCVVRCDNANIAIIQMLNNIALQRGVHRWLQFVPCKKYPTPDRIAVVLGLLSYQKLRFNKNTCRNLYAELETSRYDDNVEQKRLKENDHSLNALEYAIEPIMYKIPERLGMDVKQFKLKRKDYVLNNA